MQSLSAPRQPSFDRIIAATAGAFKNVSHLAAGGQGAVFRATTQSGEDVALKVYFGDQIDERTAREIAALQRLTSSNIARLHAAGTLDIDGTPFQYVATTFIDGDVLSGIIASRELSPTEIARVGRDIARAIDELWANDRIVHRDVKPSNIVVRPDGSAVLIDLGVARHLNLSPLTTTGKTWGTEGYMAPEHARGKALSCKADVFALGVVLQECVLRRHPTSGRQMLLMSGGPNTANLRDGLPGEPWKSATARKTPCSSAAWRASTP